ncbi:hypothetical protein F5B19DRAFT_492071 [Rostrohypoxylon terebratum]|nr:hypothetical protein F5B19DRAFT_492071 [Rostrohypoxylon terebratum]
MDATLCEQGMFLRTLNNFLQLETLVLHTQTVLQTSEESQRGKKGRPWRSGTVNVGGWKSVMVRRISEIWHQQNRCGFFAERCFVVEKDATLVR